MRTLQLVVLGAAAALLAACGTADGSAPPAPADKAASAKATETSPAAPPKDLTCPTDLRVATDGGLLAELPNGYDTRAEAVEAFLAVDDQWGDDYVLAEGGESAWILREDGTAEARVSFLRHQGFTVHGYQACASE